jgi:hypothetical protein
MTLASKTWPTYRGTVAYAKPDGRFAVFNSRTQQTKHYGVK